MEYQPQAKTDQQISLLHSALPLRILHKPYALCQTHHFITIVKLQNLFSPELQRIQTTSSEQYRLPLSLSYTALRLS